MSYPLTPPNPEKARAEHAALLDVEEAARGIKCGIHCGCARGDRLIAARARLDGMRSGQEGGMHNGVDGQ